MLPQMRIADADLRIDRLRTMAIWAVAFGIVEGAIVVYLREIFYPHGFSLPLAPMPARIYRMEVIREAATMFMLGGIARLGARDGLRRLAAFAFCFGIWDLVYYAVLKVALGWPASWMEWDILFLIPLPWTGPVLAPVLVSLSLIAASAPLLLAGEEGVPRVGKADWGVQAGAGLIILAAFLRNAPTLAAGRPLISFPWALFLSGLLLGVGGYLRLWRSAALRSSVRLPES